MMTPRWAAKVELPWPPKELSPNARVHWAQKAEAAQTAKAQGCYLTMKNYARDYRDIETTFEAQYTFYPPDKRKRDMDNCLAMMKNYQDGVCAALGIDDTRIKRVVLEWGDVVRDGKVVMALRAVGAIAAEEE